ncbi:MAG: hypothetical protein AAF689_14220 [Pseudomonadota bacterium]
MSVNCAGQHVAPRGIDLLPPLEPGAERGDAAIDNPDIAAKAAGASEDGSIPDDQIVLHGPPSRVLSKL